VKESLFDSCQQLMMSYGCGKADRRCTMAIRGCKAQAQLTVAQLLKQGTRGRGKYEPRSSTASARGASVALAESGRSDREGPGHQSPVGLNDRSDDGLAEHGVCSGLER
jgi:hypothetical protein